MISSNVRITILALNLVHVITLAALILHAIQEQRHRNNKKNLR